MHQSSISTSPGHASNGGLEASDSKSLKEMKLDLNQLNQMYADPALEDRVVKDLIEEGFRAVQVAR